MEPTQESVEDEFNTVQYLVEQCLAEDQKCRNNDMWLLLNVWQKKQWIKMFVPFDQVSQMIPAETITRCRRKIQNDQGKLLPTSPDILVKRKIREELIRSYFADSSEQWIINEWQKKKFGIQ
jgi:hypothetical protein